MNDLEYLFNQSIDGEVRFDQMSRWLYSTDASIYQIEPLGVIIPRTVDDVRKTLRIIRENNLSLTARGGGTSLGGQAVGAGVQLDFSKYLHRILELNLEAGWVRVEPGVILEHLNDYLKPYGVWFAPDVATSNRATIGGMIGNNSAGKYSIVYGKTLDHVLELDVVLSNGEEVIFKTFDKEILSQKIKPNTLEGHIYRQVIREVVKNEAEIKVRFPRILRRVSGYNLDSFFDDSFNLSHLIVGSEGTLAIIKSAKLKLTPRPPFQGLAVIYFDERQAALDVVSKLLSTQPMAIELLDDLLLNLARRSLAYRRKMGFMEQDAQALLLVEYAGKSEKAVLAQLKNLQSLCQKQQIGKHFSCILDTANRADAWAVRKAGLALLYGIPGKKKPIAFVEDTAVAPEQLPEFVRRFEAIVTAHQTRAAYYAHASVGCLHIRPLIDLKDMTEVRKMRSLAESVLDLVIAFGGSMSGEHGDGLARSEFNEKLFGSQIYQSFQRVKAAFDPYNHLNPGKIVNAPPMDQNLRFGSNYHPQPVDTVLNFENKGSFLNLIELCHGCGGCRKTSSGVMCPSYMATREEADSTRGRANALRHIMATGSPQRALGDRELYQVMDLCLGCKGCKAECPSGVDMAKLKYEFLNVYQQQRGVELRTYLMAQIKWLNHFGCLLAPLSNHVLRSLPVRHLLDRWLGIDKRRSLPSFAHQTFDYWFHHIHQAPTSNQGRVVLFNDCFTNYNYPQIGRAAVHLIEALGYQVILPEQRCCGRTFLSLGLLSQAKEKASEILTLYEPYTKANIPILGLEPSCVLSFRDEYPDLWGETAKAIATQSQTIQEWLVQYGSPLPFGDLGKNILLHEHCHQKSLVGSEISLQALSLPPHYRTKLIPAGCCGMAGSFGYEKEHFELSLAIGRDRLFPTIEAAEKDVEIAISGVSCRQQIAHATGKEPRHLVEILADALTTSP